MSTKETKAPTVIGKVVSDKMEKTIVVSVERLVKHEKYGKLLKRHTKLHAHDEAGLAKVGDTVRIRETRPISKQKNWVLEEVLSQ